jgi:hypothetical protein
LKSTDAPERLEPPDNGLQKEALVQTSEPLAMADLYAVGIVIAGRKDLAPKCTRLARV